MTDSTIISVRDLKIGYGSRVVLENLNFDVKTGEVFIILGGSGCGKSTLLKHIIGLHSPFGGDITINDESMVQARGKKKRSIMRQFGVLYQSGALFGSLTLGENISLPIEEYTSLKKKEVQDIVMQKLALVDLEEFVDFYPAEISGGMKKRAGLARAMALDPELLFFDEPSAGLDPISAAQLDRLILKLREELNTTMVIVTHELDSIFTIADRVIMLDKEVKSIVAEGCPHELIDKSDNEWVRRFLGRDNLKR